MKKNLIIAAGAVLVAAAVSAFVYVNNEEKSSPALLKANTEALTNDESLIPGIPTIPCVESTSICFYLIKDASGKIYNASSTGLKNI